MVIRVPFHLRRRRRCDPAVALLVPSGDPRDGAGLVLSPGPRSQRATLRSRGRLSPRAGAAVGRPDAWRAPTASCGEVALCSGRRRVVPCLLDDEARGLVRDWGLVFPPGGGALLFDRHVPVELNELLAAEPWLRRGWNAFPAPRRLADRLVEIAFKRPEPPAETLYQDLERDMPAQPDRDDPADKPAAASGEPAIPRPSDGANDEPVPDGAIGSRASLAAGRRSWQTWLSDYGPPSDRRVRRSSSSRRRRSGNGSIIPTCSESCCTSSVMAIQPRHCGVPCPCRCLTSQPFPPGWRGCRGCERSIIWAICCGQAGRDAARRMPYCPPSQPDPGAGSGISQGRRAGRGAGRFSPGRLHFWLLAPRRSQGRRLLSAADYTTTRR